MNAKAFSVFSVAAHFAWQRLELLFWTGSLTALFFMPVSGQHFSLCVLSALGFSWCPGCGLGHSVHYYLHLDFARGWHEHYLGAFALIVILYRIFQLLPFHFNTKSKSK